VGGVDVGSEGNESRYEKLLFVVVGAVLAVVPVIVSSTLQSRSNVRQVMIERRLGAIKDYSTACNRRLHLAKRTLFLGDVRLKTDLIRISAGQEILVRRYEALNREIEEARVALQAQVDVVNALFGTQLPTPSESELVPSTQAEIRQRDDALLANLRRSIPTMALECADSVKLLISKLET